MKKYLVLVLVLLIFGCSNVEQQEEPVKTNPFKEIIENVPEEPEKVPEQIIEKEEVKETPKVEEPQQTKFYNDTKWMRINMQNVVTDETFNIDKLKGETVFVEIYKNNCNACSEQNLKLQQFISKNNNSFTHVSLNTNQADDKEDVEKYINLHGFNWSFAIAPEELRFEMIKQFGNEVIKYDRAPLILVCKDQSSHLLTGGVKGEFRLNKALEKCN